MICSGTFAIFNSLKGNEWPWLSQAFDDILPGHDIPELLDEGFKRRKVLFVGKRGTAVRHHHHLEVQHHGVAAG